MDTDLLIERLASDVRRVPPAALPARIAVGIAAGGAVSLIVLLSVIGVRPDLGQALWSRPFWIKSGYAAALAAIAIGATLHLARPGTRDLRRLWPMLVAVAALAALGVAELVRVPSGQWHTLWLGNSWAVCPWRILALAGPVFVGLLWSFRAFASTAPRAAGAAAGLASGAAGALLYCLRCPESSALFVFTWYNLGILAAAAVGALLGPRLLRW